MNAKYTMDSVLNNAVKGSVDMTTLKYTWGWVHVKGIGLICWFIEFYCKVVNFSFYVKGLGAYAV